MIAKEIDRLMKLLAQLPGLGPRSGKRAALHLIKRKTTHLEPLIEALQTALKTVQPCTLCGNLDTQPVCILCSNPKRDPSLLCIIEDVEDLWAMERSGSFRGRYLVLGGVLSALDGVGPQDLNMGLLMQCLERGGVEEVIIALSATLEGQTTAHYVSDALRTFPVKVTRLAHGLPMGGDLDYLDGGTILAALEARQPLI
jgi:recombination protein RecR